jgi:hypothetical protein
MSFYQQLEPEIYHDLPAFYLFQTIGWVKWFW